MADETSNVTLTIDGIKVSVPEDTNLIEAARNAGIEIPHYCYHQNLSVVGNCRMCQVEVEGMRKLTIACNTGARDGMVVRTHETSETVADAQRATLEFLLVNHPLDCTVCDQAGHCKLQDYYFEYHAKASRFAETKIHKVKAEPLGPEIVYDGERCILCTRCIRFCDEVTGTSELGLFNRGGTTVVGISPERELDNPLAGCVVDLCPVGALTHRRWRFNTRIWYTNAQDTICTGCSTGCNSKVFVRDNQIVQVKARNNQDVNKEWMCDEGRYGFVRFQPTERLLKSLRRADKGYYAAPYQVALDESSSLLFSSAGSTAIFLSPFLTVEEMWVALRLGDKISARSSAPVKYAVPTAPRSLSATEAILISPDYAANARAACVLGLGSLEGDWRKELHEQYQRLLAELTAGSFAKVLFVGDFSLMSNDLNNKLESALFNAEAVVSLLSTAPGSVLTLGSQAKSTFHGFASLVLPSATINETSGIFINKDSRVQRVRRLLHPPKGVLPIWRLLADIASAAGEEILPKSRVVDERSLFRYMVSPNGGASAEKFSGLKLSLISEMGITLSDLERMRTEGKATKAA